MKRKGFNVIVGGILGLALGLGWSMPALAEGDPLPSWNATPTKQAIVEFVGRVTKPGGPDFVAPAERIATFDNDGTLWVEQPMYVQLAFALDRVRAMAPQHPEWAYTEPFQSVLEGNIKALAEFGEHDLVQLIMVTHAGMTTDEFSKIVTDWLATARDTRFRRPYTELVYQPTLELLSYLRANGFKTFIVSGGGVEFMRPWTEKVYDVLPEQVVGSSIKTKSRCATESPHYSGYRKSILLTTRQANRLQSTKPSAAVRWQRSEIPTVISRCSSGRPSVRACALGRSFITRTPRANMLTTDGRISDGSTSLWTPLPSTDGR
jgi:phosphoglycolate phosphatase-like HAD superfamily hydrolase